LIFSVSFFKYGPLIFDCNTGEVITNDLWPNKKKQILSEQKDSNSLLLVGPYFKNETESDGIARAEAVKALFTEVPPEDIYTSARYAEDCEATKTNMLHELRYKWVTRNDDVVEYLDKIYIFYEYNSDKEVSNDNVLAFFDKLSKFLISTGDKIVLTGHSSSEGDEDYNEDLGLRRANEYKEHLISLGVSPEKITTRSKGETEPIASNDTEEGRAKNRRVEINIIE
jgi:hypothetical protein